MTHQLQMWTNEYYDGIEEKHTIDLVPYKKLGRVLTSNKYMIMYLFTTIMHVYHCL